MPFSGGTSTALTVLAYSATLASGAQCANGGYRTYKLYTSGTEQLDWLDSQEWYVYSGLALDTISVAGGVGASYTSIKTVMTLRKAAPHKSIFNILNGLQRQERKRLTEELIRLQNPGISNKALKEMIRTGMVPKRFKQTQITASMRSQVIDLLGAGASLIGSGLSGIINKTGSKVSIFLFESLEDNV